MDKDTSLYLDVVRPIAAIIVFLSHVNLMLPGHAALFAHLGTKAVDIFFVLSGFLIAHVCATKEKDWRQYAFSRVVRIYSVVLPAIILTFVLDFIGMGLAPEIYSRNYQDFSVGLLLRSIFFLNEQWSAHRFPGTNSPYWSLGFEVWYYIAFGFLIFLPKKWGGALALVTLAFVGPKVSAMAPAWLLGVVAYRGTDIARKGGALPVLLFLSPVPLLCLWMSFKNYHYSQPFINLSLDEDRLLSLAEDYVVAGAFTLNLLGFTRLSQRYSSLLRRWGRSIRWVAGATFAIYLFHMPIVTVLVALSPFEHGSEQTFWIACLLTVPLCMFFAELSERRKDEFRQGFEKIAIFFTKRMRKKIHP